MDQQQQLAMVQRMRQNVVGTGAPSSTQFHVCGHSKRSHDSYN